MFIIMRQKSYNNELHDCTIKSSLRKEKSSEQEDITHQVKFEKKIGN